MIVFVLCLVILVFVFVMFFVFVLLWFSFSLRFSFSFSARVRHDSTLVLWVSGSVPPLCLRLWLLFVCAKRTRFSNFHLLFSSYLSVIYLC